MKKNKLSSHFKNFDIFGKPVLLLIDGQSSFKTLIGATCTIALYLVVLWTLAHGTLYNAQRAG